MPDRPTITRWRWRSRMPGGKWQRCPIAMTEDEAARHAKAYEPVGVSVEMEKIAGSEQQERPPAPGPDHAERRAERARLPEEVIWTWTTCCGIA